MANTITNVIPRLLAMGLRALRQNAVMSRLINTDYSDLAGMKGNVINVAVPSAIAVRDVTPAVTYAANVDSAPTTVAVTLDFWKEAPFHLSDSDLVSVAEGFIPMQASEAIKALVNSVDTYLLGKHLGVYGAVGVAGTTMSTIGTIAAARKLLNIQLAPLDNRRGVLDPTSESALLTMSPVLMAHERGDQGGVINGSVGTKLGFDWYMDQNISTYVPGTAAASGYIASTASGAIGDTTLNIINATATGNIKIGDIFTLTADTAAQQYVVTVLATVCATAQKAITFIPALKSVVNTGATLIFVSVTYTVNLAFHRDAFAWASRPLGDIAGYGHQFQTAVDPISGLALRLELSRQYKQTTFSFDILGGGNIVRPDLAVKILG